MIGAGVAVFFCCMGCVVWAVQGDRNTAKDDEFRARHGFAERKDVEWAAYKEAMRRVYCANNTLIEYLYFLFSDDHLLANPVDVFNLSAGNGPQLLPAAMDVQASACTYMVNLAV